MSFSIKLKRKAREARMLAKGILSTSHPILVHIIPMRRCNLACTYCNEYDNFSKPVPLDVMYQRIDKLAELGAAIVTESGGEPMMHPQIYDIIARVRHHGMMAGIITNGYYLTPDRIKLLNEAGLEYLQISIDNVNPDEVSQKSLKVLDKKLQNLAKFAEFDVNINSVIGGGIKNPQDAVVIGRRAAELGLSVSVGIIHDGSGHLKPLSGEEAEVYLTLKKIGKSGHSRLTYFQDNMAAGKANDWKCRAGARYLYICEEGLVHYCSQQRGYPGTPLLNYTKADIIREYNTPKPCADFCTIACVHKVSTMDFWRDPQIAPPMGKQDLPTT
ncbi:MAG: radical SAM protein [Blastocatellia bacterium]|nr:radical SAM protein [Blastocatellia bacterium]